MAILWERSIVPWLDESGAPYSGAKVYFFDDGTTTPMITYTDPSLSIPHDHPVVANSAGMFPAIFLEEQVTYKFRVTTADDVLLSEVDGVSSPTTTPPDFPDSDTPVAERFQTGDVKMRWAVSAPNGWVRCNGRTIGAAASGATERANVDAENLFIFLWNNDANLSVSGGRGATANGDWDASKTIALPDFRGRVAAGLDSFGNSASGRITDAILGQDSDTLGRTGGSQTHTLVNDELPTITPTFTGVAMSAHGHPFRTVGVGDESSNANGGIALGADVTRTNQAAFTGTPSDTIGQQIGGQSAGTPAGTISSFGSDDPHNNLQPTIMVPWFIKL